jgi:hypothetical protein
MPKGKLSRHKNDETGHNNPQKSTVITTGTHKKKSTTLEQIIEHKDPDKIAQEAKVHPEREGYSKLTRKANSREEAKRGAKRDGSDSNAHKKRKHSKLHENHREQNQPQPFQAEMNELAGQNHSMGGHPLPPALRSAYDFKELHGELGDLSNDELKEIEVLAEGSHLEQGTRYLDLQNRDEGDFVAAAKMIAGPANFYVPKKGMDYIIWNRLLGVTMPARLDESEEANQ